MHQFTKILASYGLFKGQGGMKLCILGTVSPLAEDYGASERTIELLKVCSIHQQFRVTSLTSSQEGPSRSNCPPSPPV